MSSLLTSPFNVASFDNTVQTFYEGNNTARQQAQMILTEFQSHPDSWQLVYEILELSTSIQAKFIGLGILEEFIVVRWNTLPMDQRLVMRNYIVKIIIELSSDASTLRSQKTYINKLDIVLVQILKKDWPQYWPTFIQEIVDSSLNNTSLCENNIKILRLLSEEVFDFSVDHMTLSKMSKLKNQMVNEFGSVFDLCKNVMSSSSDTYLVIATLETLAKLIGWIPIQFVYQQDLVHILESNLCTRTNAMQRNLALQCLTEMIQLEVADQQYNDIIVNIYTIVIREMTRMIPSDSNIAQLYQVSTTEDQRFIELLAIFLTIFLAKYRSLVESSDIHTTLYYLLKISRVPEREIWKICLEYWGKLMYDVVQDTHHDQPTTYQDIMKQLALVMMENMVKPDDIYLVENDEGEVTRDFIKQSDTTALSKSMRDVFSLLATLDPAYIQSMIRDRIALIFNTTMWSWDELNRVCWTIGSISGAISEQQENQFLESIVATDLVALLRKEELEPNSDQVWVVASCLFYIAGQYARFLKSHWEFLSFLLQKIYVYMQNEQAGVREMACDALLKISQGCKEELVIAHQGGSVLESLLKDVSSVVSQCDPHQVCTVYEAIASIVSAVPPQTQQQHIALLMTIPNQTISKLITNNDNTATELKSIINMLKINLVACKPLGPTFRHQIQHISPLLIQCYEIASKRPDPQQDQLSARIRKLILELLETFILSNDHLELQDQNMLYNLIQVVLMDYKSNTQREPQVLSLLTSLFEKIHDPISWPDLWKETMDVEFIATLQMITANFVDHPEFRYEFYRLLRVLCRRCLIELFQSADVFQLVMDSILWGTKHTIREISQIALQTCLDMINAVSQLEDEDLASHFFATYYVRILRDILEVLVDPDCRNGFNYQSQVLSRLFEMVQEGEIYTRLFDPSQVSDPLMSNMEFLQQYTLELLCNAFPLLQRDQVEVLVMGMFEYSGELQRFQDDIRDFLIDIRQVGEAHVGEERAQEEMNAELELLRNL